MEPDDQNEIRYTGFFDRAAAAILDLIIVSTICWYLLRGIAPVAKFIGPVLFANTAAAYHEPEMPVMLGIVLVGTVLFIILSWVYSAGMTSSQYQATFGKIIMGMKVTDAEGRPLSFAQGSVRFCAKILSTLILCIGLFMIAFSEKRLGLHDHIAGTRVVYKTTAAKIPAGAGPTVNATLTQKQKEADEASRSNVKKAVLLIALPIILVTVMLAVSIVLLAFIAQPGHHPHTYVVATTAQQTNASTIIITYQGGQDADKLTALDVGINKQDQLHWASPAVGENRTFTCGTPGRDHVFINGTFSDGTVQVIFDSEL